MPSTMSSILPSTHPPPTPSLKPFMNPRIVFEVRQSIESQKDLTSVTEVNEMLFQYEESRRVLLKSIYQGNLQDDGNYRWKLRAEHAMGSSVKDQ